MMSRDPENSFPDTKTWNFASFQELEFEVKTPGNDDFQHSKFSNFPCWRMCAVLRGFSCSTWCEALSVIKNALVHLRWDFQDFWPSIPKINMLWKNSLVDENSNLKNSNLRFPRTSKNQWIMLYKMVDIRIVKSKYFLWNFLQHTPPENEG